MTALPDTFALPIDRLLARVSEALRRLPGAEQLFLFGSCADPSLKDAYSDLDLRVISADFAASRAVWPWIFNQGERIRLAYPIVDTKSESAFSLSLEGESPFHKIDIGLCARKAGAGFLHPIQGRILLWQQPPAPALVQGNSHEGLVPAPGSPDHFLVGELLSSVRYVKARLRGQHLTCWRFLSAKWNAWLRCQHWNGARASFPTDALSTWEFAALDRRLPESERLEWLDLLKLHSPQEMDRSLAAITLKIVEMIRPGYEADPEPVSRLAQEYLQWIRQQLDC